MFQLHEHLDSYALLFKGGRLFQQYVVGVLCCIEQNRLDFYRLQQNDIRREYLFGVYDAIFRGDREGSEIGGRLILPRAFTGGHATYRADIVVRVFEQKVQDFCKFLKDVQLFGYVTGQLPDPDTDPQGYRVVSEMMVHGPCGLFDSDAVCMKEGKCGKKFPKKFNEHTFFDANGYVHYRRRETNIYTTRRGVDLDNAYIVPYNRQLSLAFHAHINVEYCGWSMLIKYLFKYISKGTDKIAAKIVRQVGEPPAETNNASIKIDEIQNFIDGRNAVLIGRLANVHPTSGELFFLRMLLCHQKGCKTFQDIRTVNKRLYLTFRSACAVSGLLDDDKEWHTALEESAFSATSQQLRTLFAQILIFYDVIDPLRLWKSFWRKMLDDIPRTVSNSLHIEDLYMNDPELEGDVLYELDVILNCFSKTVTDFGHPPLLKIFCDAVRNKELIEEKGYNRIELAKEIALLVPKLNTEQ
ncbi:DNA helicase [Tanacetum coccineum]